MTVNQLGAILKDMYDNALEGEKVIMIHLFGVKYAEEIRDNNLSVRDIVIASGIGISYIAEVNKGIKLAIYVSPK